MGSFRSFTALGALALAGGWAVTIHGQSGTPEQSRDDRLEALEEKIKILERQQEVEQEEQAAKAKEAPTVTAGKEGFSFKSADGSFVLKLRGYAQLDYRGFFKDDENRLSNTFLLRRVRPILEGTLFKIFDFRIMHDFGTSVLQDAYLDARFLPQLKLRAGKFKPPVGLERLQSPTDLRFVERAYPTNLVPNRDIGVQVHGDFAGEVLSYAAGVFNGVPDGGSGDVDLHDEKDYAARIFAQPFKTTPVKLLEGLGVGIAGSYGNQEGALPLFRTAGQATFFVYSAGTAADGLRYRISPQAWYYWGSFGVLSEYVYSSQEVENGAASGTMGNEAWQVALSYVLTGEKNSYRGIDPRRPLDFAAGTWGALEVAARVNELSVDPEAFPTFANPAVSARRARGWGADLNWYWNRNVKLMVAYEFSKFTGGAASGDRADEHVIFSRIQFSF